MKIEININLNITIRIIGNKLVLRENNRTGIIKLENIKYFNCWGRKTISAYVLYTFPFRGIAVYYYEGNGRFLGGSIPLHKKSHSADLVISQTEHRQDPVKRLVLIREIERGIKHNILWLLKKHKNIGFKIDNYIKTIDSITFSDIEEPNQLKNREGRI